MGRGFTQSSPIREQIDTFEKSPFDGTVISVTGKDGDKSVDLAWQAFSTTVFKREQFAEAVKDLKAARPKRFTENFLRFNDTPGGVDFFDDAGWSAIVNNAKVAAWVARQGGLKGWMFDTEQYEKQQSKAVIDARAGTAPNPAATQSAPSR